MSACMDERKVMGLCARSVPPPLRWRVRRWWTSEMRCYRFPCWWRSSVRRCCCSRVRRRRRRWCSLACGGRWWAASAGTPAGRGRAKRKHKRSPVVPVTRRPLTWKQRSGRNGGRSHCLFEGFQCHCGPLRGRPFLTCWLQSRMCLEERKERWYLLPSINI